MSLIKTTKDNGIINGTLILLWVILFYVFAAIVTLLCLMENISILNASEDKAA